MVSVVFQLRKSTNVCRWRRQTVEPVNHRWQPDALTSLSVGTCVTQRGGKLWHCMDAYM